MPNIRLKLSYDGAGYLGWQKTPMGPTIEGTLEGVLATVLQDSIHLQAASRTDAGVHACGQVVNFFTSKTVQSDQLQIRLNSLLPKDIAVFSVEEVHDSFHPTLDCQSKEYHYYVCYGKIQLPQDRFHSWHYPCELNLAAMKEVIPLLIGQRDFSAFCNAKKEGSYSHYVRNLQMIQLFELPDTRLRFEVRGNSFLYKMVRNLIGTLIYVGRGKIQLEEIKNILEGSDRRKAGMTAPAHALFLYRVNYSKSESS